MIQFIHPWLIWLVWYPTMTQHVVKRPRYSRFAQSCMNVSHRRLPGSRRYVFGTYHRAHLFRCPLPIPEDWSHLESSKPLGEHAGASRDDFCFVQMMRWCNCNATKISNVPQISRISGQMACLRCGGSSSKRSKLSPCRQSYAKMEGYPHGVPFCIGDTSDIFRHDFAGNPQS